MDDHDPTIPVVKRCPFCGEEILAVAIKCKHCRSMLSEPGDIATPKEPDATAAQIAEENFRAARTLYDQDRYQDAVTVLQQAASLTSNNVEYFVLLADCLVKVGRVKDAENAYLKAIELDPSNPRLYASLGLLYKTHNMPKRAEVMLQKVYQLERAHRLATRDVTVSGMQLETRLPPADVGVSRIGIGEILGYLGVIILVVGVFLPPVVINRSFFEVFGTRQFLYMSYVIPFFIALTLVSLFIKEPKSVLCSGAGIMGGLILEYWRVRTMVEGLREEMAAELASGREEMAILDMDEQLEGLIDTMVAQAQPQWGWGLLFGGAALLIACGLLTKDTEVAT